jgi:hypothetical protein
LFYKKKAKIVFKQYKKKKQIMTKQQIVAQNFSFTLKEKRLCCKRMLPTMANWRKKDDGNWIHKDEPRNLRGNALETYKKTLTLTQEQREILINSLLGDGFIHFHRSTKQPTYGFGLAQT